MNRGLLPGLILLVTVFACSRGDSSPTPSDDPEELANQIADAWADVDGGFHASFATDESQKTANEVDYASADLVKLHTDITSSDTGGGVTCFGTNDGSPETCVSVTPRDFVSQEEEHYSYDSFLTKHGYLSRTCEEDDCSGYAFFPYDYYGGAFLGITQSFPLSQITRVLDELREPSIVSSDEDGLIHLAAKFQAGQVALDETVDFVQRHGLDFGNSCDTSSSFGGGLSDAPPPATTKPLACHNFTATEFRDANKERVASNDQTLQTIDIWISPDSLLPKRMRFSQPQNVIQPIIGGDNFASSDSTQFDLHFSQYGDISVQVPQIEIE